LERGGLAAAEEKKKEEETDGNEETESEGEWEGLSGGEGSAVERGDEGWDTMGTVWGRTVIFRDLTVEGLVHVLGHSMVETKPLNTRHFS
jgi:hypothetical protein